MVKSILEGIVNKVEIALVNDNPVINYLAGSLKKPDEIVWLYQSNNIKNIKNVEALLKTNQRVKFTRKRIPSGDFNRFGKILEEIKEQYKEKELLLNLSGNDQVAGLMLYDNLRKDAKDIFIVDAERNSIINLKEQKADTIHTNLTVNEYIRLYGMEVSSGIHFDPKIGERSRLTYFIGNNMDLIVPFLDKVRVEITRDKDTDNKKWELNKRGTVFKINKEQQNYKIIYGRNNNQNEIELNMIGEEYLFRGEWLRELVFLRVNKSHFGDVRLNINLDPNSIPKRKKIETIIDVAMRRRCKFYIFQCFSYPITKNSFIALNSISRTIDELDAESFILLSHRPPNSFIARAHSAGIKIVYGAKIANFSI